MKALFWRNVHWMYPLQWVAGFVLENKWVPCPRSWWPYVLGIWLGHEPHHS